MPKTPVSGRELAKECLDDAVSVARALSVPGTAVEIEAVYSRDLTEGEYYQQRCGSSIAWFLTLLEFIEHIPVYLGEYTRTYPMRKMGITRKAHISYHMENFFVRASGFEDRSLHLVQAVLHLGLDSRDVNRRVLQRNTHVRSAADLTQLLRDLQGLCQPYSGERNQIIHERAYLDQTLRRIELWLLASRLNPEGRGRLQSMYIRDIRQFVEEKTAEIEGFVSSAGDYSERLFEALLPRYRETRDRLSD